VIFRKKISIKQPRKTRKKSAIFWFNRGLFPAPGGGDGAGGLGDGLQVGEALVEGDEAGGPCGDAAHADERMQTRRSLIWSSRKRREWFEGVGAARWLEDGKVEGISVGHSGLLVS
jgi:hypothetical protein